MALEDFKNNYTEVDAGTFINADTADTRANFVNMDLANDSYFHKDFGLGHFTNYTHLIDFYLDEVLGADDSRAGYSAGTTVDDNSNQTDAFQVYWYGRTAGPRYRIYCRDASDANTDFSALSLDTTYYLKVIRAGTAWSVEIYDAAERGGGDLLDTISVTGTATAFQFILAAQSTNAAGGDRDISGWMENLDLQEAVVTGQAFRLRAIEKYYMPIFDEITGKVKKISQYIRGKLQKNTFEIYK